MKKNKENILSLGLTKALIYKASIFLVLTGLATFIPAIIHIQFITGPIINATLFLSVMLLGTDAALLVGLIPSLVAFSSGLLPAVLAPMIPFIMVSNALLVMIFSLLVKKNYWLGVIAASILKFAFLFSTSSIVINLLLKKEVAGKVAEIMSYPQLITALTGGIIAWLILGLRKTKKPS